VGDLACLPTARGERCAQICDDGVSSAACACPPNDADCAADPGLALGCERWDELAAGLRACVRLEACTDSTACDDNAISGLSECAASPYPDVSGSVCSAP
jgi:hypothetical protein